MTRLWLLGLLRRRFGRLAGVAAGIAVTVALLASLAAFLADSSSSMTRRAVTAVPVDWQVQLAPDADLAAVRNAITTSAGTTAIQQVSYANVDGLEASAGGTVQTTGPGKAIAFDDGYLKDFPEEVRLLSGRLDGVLAAQQTAANLHVAPGDIVSIKRVALPPVDVKIDGIIELPDADALFQSVGLPPQAAPQAPPDNVLVLPSGQWQRVFGPQQTARPDTTRTQLHVRLDRTTLPVRPSDAWTSVTGAARNLEARVAGQALVANNLGARLDAVRGDSLYAAVLFLFLGIPGIALACLLTVAVSSAGADRRRAEQVLLRVRGASLRRILMLASAEALLVGGIGIALGLGLALLFARLRLGGDAGFGIGAMGLSILTGLLLALASFLYPAWRDSRMASVSASRRVVSRTARPLWARLWLDVLLLCAALVLFWQSASTGYQVVLAPEGVAATAVDYNAFIAPALFWIGSALLAVRVSARIITANGVLLKTLVRPAAGTLSTIVAAALSHQVARITAGIAMTALAVSFAVSTAVFNTTYNAQARVDAELTNGADVTVFGTEAHPAGARLDQLAALPSADAVQPMQHRFAYVGNDLQDLYGIDPVSIDDATDFPDAYFAGGKAANILARLAETPNGVLVSEETVQDFQLSVGDTINLRLLNASDHQYHQLPFTFIGVVREFPTAPRDSFLVANAAYVAEATGSDASEYVLMRAKGDPTELAGEASAALAGDPALKVRDVGSAAHLISSSLTAVDLSSLTTIELSFALALAVAAAGLMLGLGFLDRRRSFAILSAIGAKPHQLAAFLWGEGLLVAVGGLVFGLLSGLTIAWMLVKLLTGVFDPPAQALSVPFAYLALVLLLLIASIVLAIQLTRAIGNADAPQRLREL
ncbi:MAG: ABC transporter permease [Proteobacteria bacterium]|nr:ABC transporter permease [Pseudomonadota bacterium]